MAGLAAAGMILAGCGDAARDTSTRDESGSIVEGGAVGVLVLNEGDCLVLWDQAEAAAQQVETVDALPCDQEHDGEVILRDDAFYADAGDFPGDDVVSEQGDEACVAALEQYTGEDYLRSPYGVLSMVPTEDSWSVADDRGLVCIGVTLDEDSEGVLMTVGSIRG